MFAVMDCGTTNTRIYVVDENKKIIASGNTKVGVRDTSITGSRDRLRTEVTKLFNRVLDENNIKKEEVEFLIASGMVTSEIGLMEIPHLVTPVGLNDLSNNIVRVRDDEVLPIHCPIYFIRGTKNDTGNEPHASKLPEMDFMRGEEVQCMGIIDMFPEIKDAFNIVALSSHTKIMAIDKEKRICASSTSISGQFYELIVNSTNIGTSVVEKENDPEPRRYTDQEMIDIAYDCVMNCGLSRTMLMPRFLQVLTKTNSKERHLFLDAAIAADDIVMFRQMRERGYDGDTYIFFGHESRCKLYTYLLKKYVDSSLKIISISDAKEIGELTVKGATKVALETIKNK